MVKITRHLGIDDSMQSADEDSLLGVEAGRGVASVRGVSHHPGNHLLSQQKLGAVCHTPFRKAVK